MHCPSATLDLCISLANKAMLIDCFAAACFAANHAAFAASDISQLEMTSYALQQILQHFTSKRMRATTAVMHVSQGLGRRALRVQRTGRYWCNT